MANGLSVDQQMATGHETGPRVQHSASLPRVHAGIGRADLHLHTTASDGLASPEAVLERALQLELDVIAVTDHDTLKGAWRVRELVAQRGYPIEVIVGIEATTVRGIHLLALFVERPLERMYQPIEEAIDTLGAQGGLCLAPHPLSPLTPSLGRRMIDGLLARGYPLAGVETHNPTPAGQIVARQVARHNLRWQLAGFGGSDAHFLPHVGSAYTLFPGWSSADLRAALVARTTTGCFDHAVRGAVPLGDYLRQVERSMVRSPARKLARAIRAVRARR
jgi:predicted metal-dependent phosphoesterase TrpH